MEVANHTVIIQLMTVANENVVSGHVVLFVKQNIIF